MPDLPPAFGDATYPYLPAFALECGTCGGMGFATGTLTESAAVLAKAGWVAHPTRTLCPSCASADS